MPFIRKLRLFPAVALLVLCMPQQSRAAPCPPKEPILAVDDIPDDVCKDFDFKEFGNMAWETFKTLVWPSSIAHRGKADKTREITAKDRPLVFETYKSDWETFPASKIRPLGWQEHARAAPVCTNQSTMESLDERSLVLAASHKFRNLDQRFEDPTGEFKDVVHVVVAQNGSLVRYLTAFGESAFNAILENELYKPVGVPYSDEISTQRTRLPLGSVAIKTAWIELDENIPDHSRFYFREALVQEPFSGTCHPKKVGLVGFHIAHKTKQSPQWLWASFEHAGNVPLLGEKRKTTFNDGAGTIGEHPPESAWIPIKEIPAPYNVARVKDIPEPIKILNKKWQKELSRSVWAHYELVAVQWPVERKREDLKGVGRPGGVYPSPPCTFGGEVNVANSVIETFMQRHITCPKDLTCMSCHNKVRNYDFIWSIPLANQEKHAGDPSGAEPAVLHTLRGLIEQMKQ